MGENEVKLWFVEEKRFDGTWQPCCYRGDLPVTKRTDAARKTFRRAPVLVKPEHRDLSLRGLAQRYSPDGAFAAMNGIKREQIA